MSAKIGRNDPCSCGSGKKYKNCCGRPGAVAVGPVLPAPAPSPSLPAMWELLRARRYAELETQARAALAKHPDRGILWKLLGAALHAQQRDALEALQTAARLLPEDAEAQTHLGNVLRARGRLDEAADRHQRAILLNPSYAEAHANLGSVLHDLGQLEAAAVSFREATRLKPQLALAHHNLGIVLRELGQAEEAVDAHRRALALMPDSAGDHAQLSRALANLRRHEEAEASLQRALDIGPQRPEEFLHLADALLALERFEAAAEHYQRVLSLQPTLPEAQANLGLALSEIGRLPAAYDAYRRALELRPNSAEMHKGLGGVLLDLGRPREAEASFERALALEPRSTDIMTRLAMLQRSEGRTAQAEENINQALQLDPGCAPALIERGNLAMDRGEFEIAETLYREAFARDSSSAPAWANIVATRRMTQADAPWLIQAEQLAARLRRPREQARLRFAMGKYLDDIGEYDRAFASYRLANELVRTYRPHDQREVSEKFEFVRRLFDAKRIDSARTLVSIERQPIFVVGMPRSGTSLAEQILASHPAVFGAGELTFWDRAALHVAAASLKSGIDPALLGSLATEYDALLAALADRRYIVDKMPANFAHLGLICAALPGARIIHMRRHPIDTCLSIYFQDFLEGHSYASDLDDIAHYYDEYRRLMSHWLSVLPPNAILEVPYEALVAQPELWSRRMVEFVGLPWDPACLDFHRARRTVRTASRWQVRQGISTGSVERWRRYAAHLGPLLRLDQAISA